MLLCGVAMVRNEADIIEAFVRHTVRTLDCLWIVDHRSDDGTRDILAALADERLPVIVGYDDERGHRQSEVITRLARMAFEAGADVVVPLDADEMLKVPSRRALEAALATIPRSLCGALAWQTYVPAANANLASGSPRWRRASEAHGLHKVVLTRAFERASAAVVGPGNHTVLMSGSGHDLAAAPVRLALLPAGIAALAHMPVRSSAQIVKKVTIGWAAHQAAGRDDPALAFHWRELALEFARTGPPDAARLREIAVNYGIPMARWARVGEVALVEGPLDRPAPARDAGLEPRNG